MFQIFIYIIVIFIHKFVFGDFDATDINIASDGISNNLVLIFFKHSNFFCQFFDCSIILGQCLLYIFDNGNLLIRRRDNEWDLLHFIHL